jgi:hypothetical protein
MSLLWVIVAFLVGLFLPAPYSTLVRGWVSALWTKISGKTPVETKSKGCCS